MSNKTPPAWLEAITARGMQMLVALSLKNQPASDTLTAALDVWLLALMDAPIAWDEDLDTPRLEQAFLQIIRTAEAWPAPAQILKAMPDRRAPASLPPPKTKPMPPEIRRQMDALKAAMTLKS